MKYMAKDSTASITFSTVDGIVTTAHDTGAVWALGKRIDKVISWFHSKGCRIWVSAGPDWHLI